MSQTDTFEVQPGWKLMLIDLGTDPVAILKKAGLPANLFNKVNARISTDEWFCLWDACGLDSEDPNFALKVGSSITVESFDPLVFAALCSDNLKQAFQRMATYKKLVCPVKLHLKEEGDSTRLDIEWTLANRNAPENLIMMELVYFMSFVRIALRQKVTPLKVFSPALPNNSEAYTEFFGVEIELADHPALVFHKEDAERQFLTINPGMWNFFEPDLRKRLQDMEGKSSISKQVRAVLLELLPLGEATVDAVAQKLGASRRTLQRQLKQENNSFIQVLNNTRTDLANHYLKNSQLSTTEISFLLGFDDPNSFFRAFQKWTGATPSHIRTQNQAPISSETVASA